jgi:acetylornithine/succinyldiaminopimelate/putrescine aminotransferase
LDHFQSQATLSSVAGSGVPLNFIDARRCTVQLENGHLYLDAIVAPGRSLIGHDEPRSAQMSAAEAVALIDAMSARHRCVALTTGHDEALTLAAEILTRRSGEGTSITVVPAEHGEPQGADDPLVAFENVSLGRSGRWLASTGWGRPPDAIVIGDALAGGAPFAAVLADQRLCDADVPALRVRSCSAESLARVAAVMTTVRDQGLLEYLPALDRYLRDRLESVAATQSAFGVIEFSPLRAIITMPTPVAGARLKRRLCERGVLVGLNERGGVVIAPPLVIRPAEIDVISGALRAAAVDRPWRPALCCPACAAVATD